MTRCNPNLLSARSPRLQSLARLLSACFCAAIWCAVLLASAPASLAAESPWIRPASSGDPLIWGRKDGIVFGLPSNGGIKGPRGLIRIAVNDRAGGPPQLLNYIAIEPVVLGPGSRFNRMGFSELEASALDPGQRGKRLWVDPGADSSASSFAGELKTIHVGSTTIERLSVTIRVERFTANDAHVYVVASIDSDHPSELRLSVYSESDSPPLEELTTTATMGNYERLRLLWLDKRAENSLDLFSSYQGDAFVERENYPLQQMLRTKDGDAIVYCTSNEASPQSTPGNDTAHWKYVLPKYTQYWRVAAHDIQPDLRVRVNARRVYWASHAPVLGGIAFENFEVRQRYIPGQTFIFGVSEQEPWMLDTRLSSFNSTHSSSSAPMPDSHH